MYRILCGLVLSALYLDCASTSQAEGRTAGGTRAAGAKVETKYKWVNVTRKAAYAPRDGAGALVF